MKCVRNMKPAVHQKLQQNHLAIWLGNIDITVVNFKCNLFLVTNNTTIHNNNTTTMYISLQSSTLHSRMQMRLLQRRNESENIPVEMIFHLYSGSMPPGQLLPNVAAKLSIMVQVMQRFVQDTRRVFASIASNRRWDSTCWGSGRQWHRWYSRRSSHGYAL
jgi:hypothetical protein